MIISYNIQIQYIYIDSIHEYIETKVFQAYIVCILSITEQKVRKPLQDSFHEESYNHYMIQNIKPS